MLKAVTRQAASVDAKIREINADPTLTRRQGPISTAYFFDHHATPEDIAVMVTEEDFLAANRELVPSVSAGELAHYEQVRAMFEGSPDKDTQKPVAAAGLRAVSGSSVMSRASSKGKGKAVAGAGGASKGKGKAVATGSEDEFESGGDVLTNGKGKGKGKAVAGFQDGTASDDEGLY